MWCSSLGEGTSMMGVPRPGSGRRVQTAKARIPVWVRWSGTDAAASADGALSAGGEMLLCAAALLVPMCGTRGQLG